MYTMGEHRSFSVSREDTFHMSQAETSSRYTIGIMTLPQRRSGWLCTGKGSFINVIKASYNIINQYFHAYHKWSACGADVFRYLSYLLLDKIKEIGSKGKHLVLNKVLAGLPPYFLRSKFKIS